MTGPEVEESTAKARTMAGGVEEARVAVVGAAAQTGVEEQAEAAVAAQTVVVHLVVEERVVGALAE